MKIFWANPSDRKISLLLNECRHHGFSYGSVGSTCDWDGTLFAIQPKAVVENGYLIQRRRTKIGVGATSFDAAVTALRSGTCFDLPWVGYHCRQDLAEGVEFCIVANAFGLHPASTCRVVYVDEQENEFEKSTSIGIGTLPVHAAIGEEKLAVTWNKETGDVDFLIGSYSKPASWLSKLFISYLRHQQKRFAQDAGKRMESALVVVED
jgi:uncharacterized protein (UPF0548 family)